MKRIGRSEVSINRGGKGNRGCEGGKVGEGIRRIKV